MIDLVGVLELFWLPAWEREDLSTEDYSKASEKVRADTIISLGDIGEFFQYLDPIRYNTESITHWKSLLDDGRCWAAVLHNFESFIQRGISNDEESWRRNHSIRHMGPAGPIMYRYDG